MPFALPEGSEGSHAPNVAASVARMRPFLPWLAVACVLGSVWTASTQGVDDLVPTVAGSGIAVLLLHAGVTWGRWRELGIAGLTALVGVMGWVGGRLATGWLPGPVDTVGSAGWALLALLAYRAATRSHEDARLGGGVVVLAAVLLLLTPAAFAMAYATTTLLPYTWDAPALVLDESFPVHSFHVGRWLAATPAMQRPVTLTYEGIFFLLPGLAALRLRLRTRPPVDLLAVCVIVCLVGQIGYYVTPIMGPAFAFPDFPGVIPPLRDLPIIAIQGPPYLRNGMPSLHTAWALVFLWNTRPLSLPVRAFGVVVLILTVMATLGFGQHYVIDLVAAAPFAATAQVSMTEVPAVLQRARRRLIASGGLLTFAWVVAPHLATSLTTHAPWAVVLAAAVTVALALAGERWIWRRTTDEPAPRIAEFGTST